MVSTSARKNLIGIAVRVAIVIMILFGIPLLMLFGKGGIAFPEVERIFLLFSLVGTGFLIGTISLVYVEQTISKGDKKYGSGLGFSSPGDKPGLPVKPKTSTVILVSFTIFVGLALVFTLSDVVQSFTGIDSLPQQQFTEFDNALFRWLVIPMAENLGAAFFFAFTLFILRTLARKYNWKSNTFTTLSIIMGTLVVTLYGVVNHLVRYGDQETALFTVGVFWAVGGFITVLVQRFTVFWEQHVVNNASFDLRRLFGNDDVVIGFGLLFVVLGIASGVSIFRNRKNKKS